MKGISKTTHAGLDPLIPAVLAPLEVLAQAPQGFIPPPLNPRLQTSPGVPQYLDSTHSGRLFMTRSLLFATLLVLCLPLAVRAGEVSVSPHPQLSAKLIGVTVAHGLSRRESEAGDPPQGRRAGGRLYRLSPGGRGCLGVPSTESPGPLATRSTVGPLWSFSQPTLDYDGTGAAFGTWETLGAVTVGLH